MQDFFIYLINTWILEGKWMGEGFKVSRATEGTDWELDLE